jgi:hypothetical protein
MHARNCWPAALVVLPFAAAAAAHGQAPFFRTDSVIAVTIRTDVRALRRDRDTANAVWREGTLRVTAGDRAATVPVRLRTRGVFRLRTCDFPPIRLRFSDDSVRGTPLQGLRRPKLVTHCMDRGDEEPLLQEYALYQVYRMLTPASFAVRLARVTWEDTAGATRPLTRYAIVSEDPERLAERLGGTLLDTKGIRFTSLTPDHAALLGVFQYFAANTDWSMPGLHNIELVRTGDTLFALPYDFDWSGVISAPYARPDPRLPTRTVRERIYRGLCQDAEALEPALARFETLRDSIAALYRSIPGLDPRAAERTLRYHEEFYRAIADRERFVRRVVAPDCLR